MFEPISLQVVFELIILQVVFEPDPEDSSKTLSNVATCGGNSICIIDVNSGTVLMKYKHKVGFIKYSLVFQIN